MSKWKTLAMLLFSFCVIVGCGGGDDADGGGGDGAAETGGDGGEGGSGDGGDGGEAEGGEAEGDGA